MDEDSYRSTLSDIAEESCVFERSVLARHCFCQYAHIFNLAEREGIRCEAGSKNQICNRLNSFLRKNVNFTFHLKDSEEKLPYAKKIKMQAGGLHAIQTLLSEPNKNEDKVVDIYSLILEMENIYPNFEKLPIVDILKEISTFKVRHRKK